MTFENQNTRGKIRLELSEGVLIEVPLYVVVKGIQEAHMNARGVIHNTFANPALKDFVHWGFPDFFAPDNKPGMVHLIVTTKPLTVDQINRLRALLDEP